MPIVLNGTTGITAPTYNGNTTAEYLVPVTGFKNRLINSAMAIDQRNAGASVALDGNGVYPVDRWRCDEASDGGATGEQVQDAPAGFVDSLKITTTTADGTLASGQYMAANQFVEGFNTADFNWGTANAKTVTLSFWVKSSLTGTFAGGVDNNNGDRSYVFNYTISLASTWEYKTITIAGDTSGTWNTGNARGLGLRFGLGAGTSFDGTVGAWQTGSKFSSSGAVSVIGTLNATWFITGVQLEVGFTATSFDYRPYGTELALCQRYYYQRTYTTSTSSQIGIAQAYSSSNAAGAWIQITNQFRTKPTLTSYPAPSDLNILAAGASGAIGTSSGSYTPSAGDYGIYWDVARTGGGLNAGDACMIAAQNNCTFGLSAEL
jgi:hypothetical protein